MQLIESRQKRNKPKQCCVRLNEEVHRKAKLRAYSEGMTLQDWLTELILQELEPDSLED